MGTYDARRASCPPPTSSTMAKVDAKSDGAIDQDWDVDFTDNSKKWADMDGGEKAKTAGILFAKICVILLSLYLFICSLSFLADGFRLVAGRQAGEVFGNSMVFNNPIAGMLVGVLVTVLVQSSSTSTSIVITMVAADLFTVKQAISLVMGANIGTSVTSTIVALAQSVDKNEFRRAFAAATVHDMFNFATVLVFLPLEAMTGYLYNLSLAIINSSPGLVSGEKPPDILKAITKPFTKAIMSTDKKQITNIAAGKKSKYMLKHFLGITHDDGLADGTAGVIILIVALAILCITLFLIVYTLKSILKGRIAVWIHASVNGHVPDINLGGMTIPMGWLSGYIAMACGLGITICVQSSSITTSAITPLVGVGVIKLERMYPVVLGANIGTCLTGVLAALAADGSKLALTLQVAYCHLFFNLSGIVLFYVIWPLRAIPINAAKFLGRTTGKYKWFAPFYLFMCFFLIPLIFFGVSLFVVTVNTLQTRKPDVLPGLLKDWSFLPAPMRSLEPMDRILCEPLNRVICTPLGKICCRCCPSSDVESGSKGSKSVLDSTGTQPATASA